MDTEPTGNNNQKVIAAFVVILAVVIIAVGIGVFAKKKDNSSSSTSTPTSSEASDTTSSSNNASSDNSTSAYKDGTYTATGNYVSPGGQEAIKVTVTLKDGTVTNSSVEQTPSNHDAEEYQTEFKQNYQGQVVGKKINTISLTRVSGSSLTSRGFNDALEQIRNQAET